MRIRNPFIPAPRRTGSRGPYKVPRPRKDEVKPVASVVGPLATDPTPSGKVTMPSAAELLADHIKVEQSSPMQVIKDVIEKRKRRAQGKVKVSLNKPNTGWENQPPMKNIKLYEDE